MSLYLILSPSPRIYKLLLREISKYRDIKRIAEDLKAKKKPRLLHVSVVFLKISKNKKMFCGVRILTQNF